jgi:hypothetical protein
MLSRPLPRHQSHQWGKRIEKLRAGGNAIRERRGLPWIHLIDARRQALLEGSAEVFAAAGGS